MRLLRADEMNVRIKSTGCNNTLLSRNDIRARTDNELRVYAIHDVRIPSLANPNDKAVLDANVRFVNPRPVHDQSIGDDRVQRFAV